MRGAIRRLFILHCICSLLFIPASVAWGKTKNVSNASEAISTIWEGKSDEARILYHGASGIFFEAEEENGRDEILYHYDGNKVKQINDLRGYEIDRVEEDGITVWAESLEKGWDKFRVYALVNGEKKAIADLDDSPVEIKIEYPKINWQVKYNDWWFYVKNYQYDLETNKLTFERSYGKETPATYYKSVDNHKQYLRAFDVSDFEYGGFKKWTVSNEQFVWSDQGGVYLDVRKQKNGFKQLWDHAKSPEPLTVNKEFAIWNQRDGLGIYSFEKDQSYVINASALTIVQKSNPIIFDKKLALFTGSSKQIQLNLIEVDKLLESTGSQIETFQPLNITPRYVNGVQALLQMEPTELVASSKYLAWKDGYEFEDGAILFKKIDDTNVMVMPGEWEHITFIGEGLLAVGRPEEKEDGQDDYDYEEDDEIPRGIYKINLSTQETEILYDLKNEEDRYGDEVDISELQSDSKRVYWYSEEDENIVSFDAETKAVKKIDIGTDEVIAWQAKDDSVVWIEERKREVLVKFKENGKEEQILSRWASKLGGADSVALDGNWVAWNIDNKDKSMVKLYDLSSKKEKVIYNGEIGNFPILIKDNNVYFLSYSKSSNKTPVVRYDSKANRTSVSGTMVDAFFVQDSTLYYTEQTREQIEIYYILSKKIKSKAGMKLSYKWTDLVKNNQQKWYDIRYSFHPNVIQIKIGENEYTWEELLSMPNKWLDAIEETPEDITVSVEL
ncbi:hypothetical protein [Brevibacillus sp. SYSU BS000544]|uniref:hypothetical protein n=1 Tax=Brevibacillus sp. SYSU BS000544 TaxID=3416443 RepID=UPI003CE55890